MSYHPFRMQAQLATVFEAPPARQRTRGERVVTRTLELSLALVVLALGAPLWFLIALIIKLDSRGPVLFASPRVGFLGEPFAMLKFRTMTNGADPHIQDWERRQRRQRLAVVSGRTRLVGDAPSKPARHPRMTRVGRVLRRTGLDEVPQFFHVLTGRMAVVGPRPWLPDETAALAWHHRARLQAKPGITGLWQVGGRSLLSFEESIALDLHYLAHAGLRLDLQIMLRTPWCMLTGRGGF